MFFGRRERERDKMTLRTLDGLPGVPFLAHVQQTGFNYSILSDWVRGKVQKNSLLPLEAIILLQNNIEYTLRKLHEACRHRGET